MYNNGNELKALCEESGKKICQVAIEVESKLNETSVDEIRKKFKENIEIMR